MSAVEQTAPPAAAEDAARDDAAATRDALAGARRALPAWKARDLAERLRVIERFRHHVADRPDEFLYAVTIPQRRNRAETVASELLPLADGCRFLEREAATILAPRTLSVRSRPGWLGGFFGFPWDGVAAVERRDPHGVVLIVATWNYPLLLPGIQAIQALVGGNAVLLKPGPAGAEAAAVLVESLHRCGVPEGLLALLPDSVEAARTAIDPGPGLPGADKIVLTGAAETGRAVLRQAADRLTPAAMELSGCDAVFVRGDADLDLVTKCLSLGMTFNGSATCIAPRRVLVHEAVAGELGERLRTAFADIPAAPVESRIASRLTELVEAAVADGAELASGSVTPDEPATVAPHLLLGVTPGAELVRSDVFAPVLSVIPVADDTAALAADAKCPYALGATVFGGESAARKLAARVDAGCVVVNDFLIPTADPRVAFGGRGESGFGVTRGGEGLREMTRPKTVLVQRSSWRPHLDPPTPGHEDFFKNYLKWQHAAKGSDRRAGMRAFLKQVFGEMRAKN